MSDVDLTDLIKAFSERFEVYKREQGAIFFALPPEAQEPYYQKAEKALAMVMAANAPLDQLQLVGTALMFYLNDHPMRAEDTTPGTPPAAEVSTCSDSNSTDRSWSDDGAKNG